MFAGTRRHSSKWHKFVANFKHVPNRWGIFQSFRNSAENDIYLWILWRNCKIRLKYRKRQYFSAVKIPLRLKSHPLYHFSDGKLDPSGFRNFWNHFQSTIGFRNFRNQFHFDWFQTFLKPISFRLASEISETTFSFDGFQKFPTPVSFRLVSENFRNHFHFDWFQKFLKPLSYRFVSEISETTFISIGLRDFRNHFYSRLWISEPFSLSRSRPLLILAAHDM